MAIGFNASGDEAYRTGSPCFTMINNTDKFTMSGWMKIRNITPGAYSYGLGVENPFDYWAVIGITSLDIQNFSTTGGDASWSTAPSQNTWYYFYITGENDAGGFINFKAGYYTAAGSSPVDTVNPSITTEFDVTRISIGNDSFDEWLDCAIAQVRVWTGSALTDSELRAERDSTSASKTSGLWADWPLADNTDTGDDSGNGRTLTFGGTLTTETDPPNGGATTASQTVLGAITPVGTLLRETQKKVSGAISPSNTIFKQVEKTVIGAITSTGITDVLKSGEILVAGIIAPIGSLVEQVNKVSIGLIPISGDSLKSPRKIISGTITSSGALLSALTAIRTFTGSVSPLGELLKIPNKIFSGIIAPYNGSVSYTVTSLVTAVGSITPAGNLIKQAKKISTGNITFIGDVIKKVNKIISGATTAIGAVATSLIQQVQDFILWIRR